MRQKHCNFEITTNHSINQSIVIFQTTIGPRKEREETRRKVANPEETLKQNTVKPNDTTTKTAERRILKLRVTIYSV